MTNVTQAEEGLLTMSHGEIGYWRQYGSGADLPPPFEVLSRRGDVGRRSESIAFQTALKLAIEREIVPRLIIAETAKLGRPRPEATAARVIKTEEIDRFRNALLRENLDGCVFFLDSLRDLGVSKSAIYLSLFAPVARQLGALWDCDELNFVDVSIAMGRLQCLLNRISCTVEEVEVGDAKHRIVLAASPGEQHLLGLSVLIEIFQMSGWYVAGGAPLQTGPELSAAIQNEWFGVVGLSASTEEGARLLKAEITALRQISRNRRVAVLVGGHGFDDHPEISRSIGADGVASDGAHAVEEAERLLVCGTRDNRLKIADHLRTTAHLGHPIVTTDRDV